MLAPTRHTYTDIFSKGKYRAFDILPYYWFYKFGLYVAALSRVRDIGIDAQWHVDGNVCGASETPDLLSLRDVAAIPKCKQGIRIAQNHIQSSATVVPRTQQMALSQSRLADLWISHEVGYGEPSISRYKLPRCRFTTSILIALVTTSPARSACVIIDGLGHVLNGVALGRGRTIVQSVNFDAANVGVLAVLVVLEHDYADEEATQRVSIFTATSTGNGDINPSLGRVKLHRGERDGKMRGRASSDLDLGRRVTLIELVVQKESQSADLNTLDEVNV